MTAAKPIACVGWGSLTYRAEDLPCRGPWHLDGPMLPVEFARESQNKTITLVINATAPRVRTSWTVLDVATMDEAKRALGVREYRGASAKWISENIGFVDCTTGEAFGSESEVIAQWAASLDLAGAVWTNLPSKFGDEAGRTPTGEEVVAHLRALEGEARQKAEDYVRKAPRQVDTPYRRLIAEQLGWTATSP